MIYNVDVECTINSAKQSYSYTLEAETFPLAKLELRKLVTSFDGGHALLKNTDGLLLARVIKQESDGRVFVREFNKTNK